MTAGATSKAELRRTALAARRTSPDRVAGDAARTPLVLGAVAGAGCITCYVSVGSEPDTRDLIVGLVQAGVRVLLPRLRADGGLDLVDRPADGVLLLGARGVPAPAGPAVDPVLAEVWVVPALLVDRSGVRLGRGGGGYDRVLPDDRYVLALLHAGELVAALPAEPHDRRVTHAVLPTGVIALKPDIT
jgi:5-formyltetrahydrofolate cyclo-ligase